jgi:hypothetical protein
LISKFCGEKSIREYSIDWPLRKTEETAGPEDDNDEALRGKQATMPGRSKKREMEIELDVEETEEKWMGNGVSGGKVGERVGRVVGNVEG